MADADSINRIKEQLEELEELGELPPIAVQATSRMLYQHSKLMAYHAKEIHSIFSDPDEGSFPWGSKDSYSFDLYEYGSKAIEESVKKDPIHELTRLRREMKEMVQQLRELKKRVITEDNSFVTKHGSDMMHPEELVNKSLKRLKASITNNDEER